MVKNKTETHPLQFLFTENGFYCDVQDHLSAADLELRAQFEADRWTALYYMGLVKRPADSSPSAAFLSILSEAFFKALTSLPDLELSR